VRISVLILHFLRVKLKDANDAKVTGHCMHYTDVQNARRHARRPSIFAARGSMNGVMGRILLYFTVVVISLNSLGRTA